MHEFLPSKICSHRCIPTHTLRILVWTVLYICYLIIAHLFSPLWNSSRAHSLILGQTSRSQSMIMGHRQASKSLRRPRQNRGLHLPRLQVHVWVGLGFGGHVLIGRLVHVWFQVVLLLGLFHRRHRQIGVIMFIVEPLHPGTLGTALDPKSLRAHIIVMFHSSLVKRIRGLQRHRRHRHFLQVDTFIFLTVSNAGLVRVWFQVVCVMRQIHGRHRPKVLPRVHGALLRLYLRSFATATGHVKALRLTIIAAILLRQML